MARKFFQTPREGHQSCGRSLARSPSKEAQSDTALQGQLAEDAKLFTESFHYFGARARDVIRMLPGLKNFESAGVRNTRNWLIEHAQKDASGVIITSFGWGAPCGPVVKAMRYEGQEDLWPDAGMYVNAIEFGDNLIGCVGRSPAGPMS